MKTKNKALLLSLCAVLLVAASVLGTMAYLTSQDAVTNTFSVGSVAITMDELDVDNSTEGENDRDKANSYTLLPGHQYTKDPIIHVASTSEDCYLFVIVKNEIAGIESDATGDKTVAAQMTETYGWNQVGTTANGNLYVYTGTDEGASAPLAVAANSNIPVFKTFKIDGDVNGTTLADYANKTITVTAYAVQKDGFEDKAASEIWTTAFNDPALN